MECASRVPADVPTGDWQVPVRTQLFATTQQTRKGFV